MRAKLIFNCDDVEERRLLACAIRSNELALACWELKHNGFRLFERFLDTYGDGLTDTQIEKLEELQRELLDIIPNNLDELVS
jgi:hypothetical protein